MTPPICDAVPRQGDGSMRCTLVRGHAGVHVDQNDNDNTFRNYGDERRKGGRRKMPEAWKAVGGAPRGGRGRDRRAGLLGAGVRGPASPAAVAAVLSLVTSATNRVNWYEVPGRSTVNGARSAATLRRQAAAVDALDLALALYATVLAQAHAGVTPKAELIGNSGKGGRLLAEIVARAPLACPKRSR